MQSFMADTMDKAYAQHRTDMRHKTGAPTRAKKVKSALHTKKSGGAAPAVWKPKSSQKAVQAPQKRIQGPVMRKAGPKPIRPAMDDHPLKPILYDMLLQEAVRSSVPDFQTSSYDMAVEPDTFGYIQRAQQRDQERMNQITNTMSAPFSAAGDLWGYVTKPGGHR